MNYYDVRETRDPADRDKAIFYMSIASASANATIAGSNDWPCLLLLASFLEMSHSNRILPYQTSAAEFGECR